MSISVDSVPSINQSLETADILLQWTESSPEQGQSIALGTDMLVFIVHPENPVTDLSRAQLEKIFSGTLTDWGEINSNPGIIQPWVFSFTDDTMAIITTRFLAREEIDQASMLAPSPESMRSAIGRDPLAIGILPARWLDTSVKKIKLTDIPTDLLIIPILAVIENEPEGTARNLLLCLQDHFQR